MKIGYIGNFDLEYHGNIFVAGLSATGKTTHCYLLAGRFGLTYISGSQIHLGINGLSPTQPRNFWVTEQAKELLTRSQFERVDEELCTLERSIKGGIFDSWIMPWRRTKEGLCILLESSLDSRVIKAAVSRRERKFVITQEYIEALNEKDQTAINLYKEQYGVDITHDLACFDLIIDTSLFIAAPTFESSQISIKRTQDILEAAVGYYLTGKRSYRRAFDKYKNMPCIRRNRLT